MGVPGLYLWCYNINQEPRVSIQTAPTIEKI